MLATYALYVGLSVKNRILVRLRRLKQPRYLLGLIVGLLYLVMVFGRHRSPVRFGGHTVAFFTPADSVAFLTVLVAAMMLLSWALPDSEAGLDLSETEALFLFPAPITRGELFGFVIARALFPQLVSALILKLFFLRDLSFLGLFGAMTALQIYFLMVKLARARLGVAGIGFLTRIGATLLVFGALAMVTYAQYARLVPDLLGGGGPFDAEKVLTSLAAPMQAFPLSVVYFVPALYARLASSTSVAMVVQPLGMLVLLSALFGWLAVRLDVSYEEATIARAKKRAARREARLNRGSGQNVSKRSPIRFPLAPDGRPEIAILWKNSMAAARTVLLILLLPMIAVVVAGIAIGWVSSWDAGVTVSAVLSFALAGFAVLGGPLLFRNDLRTDLPRLDVLRSYPLNGRQILAAEVASPTLLLLGFQVTCVMLGVVAATFSTGFASSAATVGWVFLAMLFAVPLTTIQLLIHNGIVVLFPAWASFSKEDQRGIEALGRRLLLLVAQVITLAVGLVPAAVVFVLSFLLSQIGLTTVTGSIIVGTGPALMVLAFEILWVGRFLGDQLDRIDVSDNMAITEEA